MRNMLLTFIATLALTLTTAHAADFQKGLDAYVRGDYATTLKEWKPLAEQGYGKAQHNLGLMYNNGIGVLQDYAMTVKLYTLAAEQGIASSQNNLAKMYSVGDGVPQDYVLGHMWYNIAAANGADYASKNRDIIAAEMTSADISKAQSIARECMASKYKNCGL